MSKASKVFSVTYASSEEFIAGYNPENADMTNPRGAVHCVRHFVLVCNEFGDTMRHAANFQWVDEAEKMAYFIQAHLDAGGELMLDYWFPTRAVYGSDAYIAYGQDEDLATEARELEEESWGWN
jgi:hypothetical protein